MGRPVFWLLKSIATLLVLQTGFAVAIYIEEDEFDVVKKTTCVSSAGKCFNNNQCCSGLTCVTVDEAGESPESPGQCVKSKDLRECNSIGDCYRFRGFQSANVQCVPLQQSDDSDSGRTYCIQSSASASGNAITVRSVTAMSGQRKHQSIARLLSNIAGSCETDADCQSNAINNPATRICCQQVSQGRQGTRRMCDRVTAVSICIPPRNK